MGLAGSTWSGHEFCRTGTQIFPYMSVADFARCGDEFGLECAREWVYCPHSEKGGIMPCQSHPLLCCECCAVARKLFSPRSKKKIVTPCSPPTPRCPGDYLRHRHAPGGSLSHASPPNRFHREADLHREGENRNIAKVCASQRSLHGGAEGRTIGKVRTIGCSLQNGRNRDTLLRLRSSFAQFRSAMGLDDRYVALLRTSHFRNKGNSDVRTNLPLSASGSGVDRNLVNGKSTVQVSALLN